ncbi:AGAP004334-PA-like protein [Anopheles sinensis]|uniref:AGAP004334-PA-like protein n=1 Tax=Anopheles sinensis TaxID=74873 RepID=A0A084WR05_ANOSI|nr:AGAP004334-PA-like protein [Anopheles sinensis]
MSIQIGCKSNVFPTVRVGNYLHSLPSSETLGKSGSSGECEVVRKVSREAHDTLRPGEIKCWTAICGQSLDKLAGVEGRNLRTEGSIYCDLVFFVFRCEPGVEMKYGTRFQTGALFILSVLLMSPSVTGVKHVDIFQQFQDGSYDEQQNRTASGGSGELDSEGTVRTEQPTSCVEDVLPSDPLELHEKLEEESEPPKTSVRHLAAPDLMEMFGRLSSGFISANPFRIGEGVRKVLGGIRDSVQAYVNDTVAKFEHQRYRMMTAVRQKVDQLNERIRAHWESEFVEYRDVCLPDESKCMKLLHAQIEQYEQRLRANVDECHDRLAEELTRQRREVDEAQRKMDGPYRKMDKCLDRDAGLGRSFLACTGSAVSNLARLATDALRAFAATMGKMSGVLERRVDKFDKCVVQRHRLLQQNERQVATSVKSCFEKQQSAPEDFF